MAGAAVSELARVLWIARKMAAGPPLHPLLEPVAFLLGRWKGEGEGGYPTISSFQYIEEVQFGHAGKVVRRTD